MRALRFLLIALSTAGAVFMVYVFVEEERTRLLTGSYAAGLLLNVFYLGMSRSGESESPSRLMRLIRLWLDVKEAELKRKAKV